MVGRNQMLTPVLDPFDGTTDQAGGEGDQKIFRIELAAHAKAATHIVLNKADQAFHDSHLLGEDAAVGERHLGGTVDREPFPVPFGDETARLQWHRRMTLHLEVLAAPVGCISKRRFRIAFDGRERARDIAPGFLEQQRVTVFGPGPVHHRVELDDIDTDRFRCIFGGGGAIRDDDGKRFTNIAHLPVRDDRLFERPERRELLLPQRYRRDDSDFGRGNDGTNSLALQRRDRVNGANAPMSEIAAQDVGMQHARPAHVIDVLAFAAHEAKILDPLNGTADQRIGARVNRRALGFHGGGRYRPRIRCPRKQLLGYSADISTLARRTAMGMIVLFSRGPWPLRERGMTTAAAIWRSAAASVCADKGLQPGAVAEMLIIAAAWSAAARLAARASGPAVLR